MKPTKTPEIYDINERRLLPPYPKPITGEFMRSAHYRCMARMDPEIVDGITTPKYNFELIRAQVPYLCTLIVYNSPMQMVADEREYYVYAPSDIKSAGTEALRYWKEWEGPKDPFLKYLDPVQVFPKVEHAVGVEPIDDAHFLDIWRFVKNKRHAFFGHPNDPVAFTCLDKDGPRTYKHENFQRDFQITV